MIHNRKLGLGISFFAIMAAILGSFLLTPQTAFAESTYKYLEVDTDSSAHSSRCIRAGSPIPKSEDEPNILLVVEEFNVDLNAYYYYCLISLSANGPATFQQDAGPFFINTDSSSPQNANKTMGANSASEQEVIIIGSTGVFANFVSPENTGETDNEALEDANDRIITDEAVEEAEQDAAQAEAAEQCVEGGGQWGGENCVATTEEPACEDEGGTLAFIGCPFIEGIDAGLGWIHSTIEGILVIDSPQSTASGSKSILDNDGSIHSAWAIFRNIASVMLIIVLLVMVISTALGFSFVDAYTIKKLLPRMVAAIILIQLSWPLMVFAINIINAIGTGIFGLMLAPFGTDTLSGVEATDLSTLIVAGENDGGEGLFMSLLLITAAGAGIALGFLGLLSLAFTTFLFVMIGFVVVILRNLVVLITLMFAPIAIVSWITPGSNKMWNLWWESFSKALLMFPLIMILFAGGRILAWTAMEGEAGSNFDLFSLQEPFQMILVVLAYAIPYFLIPFTIRFAGGLASTLGGFANDRSRGVFDRNKKFRQEKTSKNWQDTRNMNRFKGTNAFSRGMSRGLGTAANLDSAGLNPTRMRSKLRNATHGRAYEEAAEAAEKNEKIRAIVGNDDYLEAGRIVKGEYVKDASGNLVRDAAGRQIERDGSRKAVSAYLSGGANSRGYSQNDVNLVTEAQRELSKDAYQIMAATRITGTGTGYSGGIGELYQAINSAAGNDRGLANRMLADTRGIADRASRPDLVATGFGNSSKTMEAMRTGQFTEEVTDKFTGEVLFNAGDTADMVNVTKVMDRETLRTQDHRVIASAKPAMIKRLAPEMTRRVSDAFTSGNQVMFEQELAALAGRYDTLAQSSPERAKIFADEVLSQVPPTSTTSLREHIESRRGNTDFLDMRREYGSRYAADQAAAQTPPPE